MDRQMHGWLDVGMGGLLGGRIDEWMHFQLLTVMV